MSKVLIAGIGGGKNKKTGTYQVANYKIDDEIYYEKTFIVSALEEHYKIDKTIFIGTTGSMWDNLYEFYCPKEEYDEKYHIDLIETVDNSSKDDDIYKLDINKFNETFKGKILGIVTRYGMNELEIFENFNLIIQIQDQLKDGDEVYLDITHSFRSNAFWLFLVMNYLTDVEDKKIEIKAITYGMLEIIDRNLPKEKQIAEVVDLNAFYKILQWIKGANNFKNYGNSYLIEQNIENEKLSKKLKNFSDALNMNYIASLKQSINSLKKLEEDIESLDGPAKLIIPKVIKDFMDRFATEEKDYLFQAELAKWHFEQKRYGMSYININEAIIGFIMDVLEFPLLIGDKKRDENKLAKDWLNMAISRHKSKKPLPEYRADEDNKKLHEYIKIFEHSRKIRNEIAHSIGGKDTAVSDVNVLKKNCDKIVDLLKNREFIIKIDQRLGFSKKLKKDL